MYRGVIGLVDGAPDGEIGRLREGDVAIEGERIENLDAGSGSLVTGSAAGPVTEERDVPEVYESTITTEREKERRETYVEFLADLQGGWVTIDTSDGEFLWHTLELKHDVRIERAAIDCNALADDVREWEESRLWQTQTDWGDVDAGDGGTTIAYHSDASWPGDGIVGQLGFAGQWDGTYVRGTVAASGYVALYDGDTDEVAGQFVTEVLLPHSYVPDDEQTTLRGDSA